jgi:diguanylate cyclase (GGDEF)-like protein/PAS domain S-box-containing protein
MRASALSWLRGGTDSPLDRLVYRLSIYALPAAIALATLVSLAQWEPVYPVNAGRPIPISVLEEQGAALSPREAFALLQSRGEVLHHDTRLSEAYFWFRFAVAPASSGLEIELPSRHAVEAQCWEASTMQSIGHASRSGASGGLRAVKAGWAFSLEGSVLPADVLCRGAYSGPARISVLQWSEGALQRAAEHFHRESGLLEGGLIVLAAFVLITALINREPMYVLFAGWLVASLRLGAISAGWDTQWLGRAMPVEWILPSRQVTIAAYFILTYALFNRLLRDELRRVGFGWALTVVQVEGMALAVAALVLPFGGFLPFMWMLVAVAVVILVSLLGRVLFLTRSRVAVWYSASLGVVLFSGLYEVVAAALGAKTLIGSINSVTAALISALLVALAIAEHMRAERQARMQAQAALRATYDAIPIGLFTLDREGRFVRVNPALAAMLGIDLSSGTPRYWSDYFEPRAWELARQALRAGTAQEFEVRGGETRDGKPRWFFVKIAPALDKLEGSLQDTTERYRTTERLEFLARHDALTGVLNRRGTETVLEAELAALQPGRSLALAYLDLDRFKLINDLFGHIAGDEVLRQVCRRIETLLSESHALGRIGGDEFVIVFPGTPIRSAAAVCTGVVEALSNQPYQSGEKAFQVNGSIGLVQIGAGTSVSEAISAADEACRAAKGAHCGLIVYESDSPALKARERQLRLAKQFNTNAVTESLFLAMQPIMSLARPYGSLDFEALVRMRDADGSIIYPDQFVTAAERNGRIGIIDRWVLATTLEWLERHHEALPHTRFACMNLSGASLNDERFMREAYALLADYPRAVKRICIEITESVALHDLNNTKRFIERLRGIGAKIALDDFGAGYTSFSYLKELSADALKIDGNFVRGVNTHPANLAIVEAIAELARQLGMRSIAEWAEDRETIEVLKNAGIDYVQGYAIARPQAPETLLQARSSADYVKDEALARLLKSFVPSMELRTRSAAE